MNNKAAYKQFLQQQGQHLPLFYTHQWLDALGATWDVVLSYEGDEIAGIWPYTLEQKAGIQIIRNPLLTPYLGPLVLPHQHSGYHLFNHEEKVLNDLLNQLPAYGSLHFSTLPDQFNFLPFHHKGIKEHMKVTYKSDLSLSDEILLNGVQTRTRRYIQKTDDHTTITELDHVPEHFLQIHKETYTQKNAAYPYTAEFIRRMINTSREKNFGKFYCIAANEVKGYLWVAFDGHTMYQLLSCFDKDKIVHGLIPVLTWHAVRDARKMGLRFYDYEGSIDAGIEPFLRKFGGKRHYYLSFSHTPSKLWGLKTKLLG